MKHVTDLLLGAFWVGFGCYYVLSARWPDRFARGALGEELQRAKHAEDQRAVRTLWVIISSGLFLMGGTIIANAIVPDFPFFFPGMGIALVILSIPIITTYFR